MLGQTHPRRVLVSEVAPIVQLCGTCIVDITSGIEGCTRRSIDEASTLRENPETYKLACITNVYGDVVVKIMPKIGAAQWTR